jgi:hypothetical protein
MAEIRPQPQSPALGALARMLGAARDAAGRVRIDSQLLGRTSLADLLSLPGAAGLAEDVSYFGPAAMLRPGSGRTLQTFKLDPRVLDAADVALNVSPLGALAVQGAARAARPVARAAGEAVNRAMLTGEGPLATALAPVAPKQLIVYHGTPHRFERFDASKIGTGEGAQAYGHGLYFAESPEVAKDYQKKLSDAQSYDPVYWESVQLPPDLSATEYRALGLLREKLNKNAYRNGPSLTADESAKFRVLRDQEIARAEAMEAARPKGSLYTVDLPDEAIARMLDWDKPLSEQAEYIQPIIDKVLNDPRRRQAGFSDQRVNAFGEEMTGADLYNAANATWFYGPGGPRGASQFFRDQSIPGIRYLDQGSRGNGSIFKQFKDKEEAESFAADVKARGGEGIVQPRPNGWVVVGEPPRTSNFVVFPGAEDMLTILERKAKGGPVRRYADGGAVHAAQYDPADIARRAATLMEEFDAA